MKKRKTFKRMGNRSIQTNHSFSPPIQKHIQPHIDQTTQHKSKLKNNSKLDFTPLHTNFNSNPTSIEQNTTLGDTQNQQFINNSTDMITFRFIIQTAIDEIKKSHFDSGTTIPIKEMFESLDLFLHDESKIALVANIEQLNQEMKNMNWQSSGFSSPPNKKELIRTLNNMI